MERDRRLDGSTIDDVLAGWLGDDGNADRLAKLVSAIRRDAARRHRSDDITRGLEIALAATSHRDPGTSPTDRSTGRSQP